jgi:glycosyltransferase involved in cell wall biosynthesis
MDGLEWKRSQWSWCARTWLRMNEWLAIRFADHMVADHPEIRRYLASKSITVPITMIPYGADPVNTASEEHLKSLKITAGRYALVVARPEKDNSILEIVRAYSQRPRGLPLIVVGAYRPDSVRYHAEIIHSASDEVKFVGPVFEKPKLQALRFYARLYLHGHQVGGTNPSLVEALGAGNAVLAHDNQFNRWVAKDAAMYFTDTTSCAQWLDVLLSDDQAINRMRKNARVQFRRFKWGKILRDYEQLLLRYVESV